MKTEKEIQKKCPLHTNIIKMEIENNITKEENANILTLLMKFICFSIKVGSKLPGWW